MQNTHPAFVHSAKHEVHQIFRFTWNIGGRSRFEEGALGRSKTVWLASCDDASFEDTGMQTRVKGGTSGAFEEYVPRRRSGGGQLERCGTDRKID